MRTYPDPPYMDDYDPEKGFTQVLGRPGLVLQAREFTQAQTIQRDNLERVVNAIYEDGTIVQGCGLTLNGLTATVSDGRVVLGGSIRLLKASTLDITGEGTEVIGIKLVTDIVDETMDESLRDPYSSYANYNKPGCTRERQRVLVVLNDDDARPLYILEDGEIVKESVEEESSVMNDILAKRTFDESGNYRVSGLIITDRGEVNNKGKILISVSDGVAYIKGYNVTKQHAVTVALNKSQTYRTVLSEPKTMSTAVDKYYLNNNPVFQITSVSSTVNSVTNRTRGGIAGGADSLPHSPVDSIVSVTQGSTTYVQGVDYQLTNDAVDWSLFGAEPVIGSTYTVNYNYIKPLVEGEDYVLESDEDNNYYIRFLDSGDKPVVGSTFYITYDFYLYRIDLISMDRYGNVQVAEGVPNTYSYVESVVNQDPSILPLGTVLVHPNSSKIEVNTFRTNRLTMEEIYNLQRRLDDTDWNTAIQDLDKEAVSNEPATQLKGVFTDGFIGLGKCDLEHLEYNCCLDIDRGEMTLPFDQEVVDVEAVSSSSTFQEMGNVLMAPWVNEEVMNQKLASRTYKINEYAKYDPICPVKLTPDVDTWIDKTIEDKSVTNNQTVNQTVNKAASYTTTAVSNVFGGVRAVGTSTTSSVSSSTSSSTSVALRTLLDEALMYMRTREVIVEGSNYNTGEGDLTCYFNDTKVALTPISPYRAGTEEGTLQIGSDHKFKGKFFVPAKTPCGTVQVRCESGDCIGRADYTSVGRRQLIERTTTTTNITTRTTTVLKTTHFVNYTYVPPQSDPIAQTFWFDKDTILTRVDVYFATKDASRSVMLQIRDVENGYPSDSRCYVQVEMEAANVNVSSDGSVATTFNLQLPIYCEANKNFCFVLLSDVNTYSVYAADLGEHDIISGNTITRNPTDGVMFTSSNGSTWIAHPKSDLKFKLHKARFTGKGLVEWNGVSMDSINKLFLTAATVDYKNLGLYWYFRTDAENSWLPIDEYALVELGAQANNVDLKVELEISESTSPFINKNSICLVGFIDGTEAVYVSRNVFFDEQYTKLTISVEMALPPGCGFNLYYKQEDLSDEWVPVEASPTVTVADAEFKRFDWTNLLVSASRQYRVKLVLTTNSVFNRPRARRLINIMKY